MEAHANTPAITRDTEYFEHTIGTVRHAKDLVADRRLLRVALGAFGLEADLDNRFFIRRILEEGTQARDALANRLSDDRYRRFADAFGFAGGGAPRTAKQGFGAEITALYRRQGFETAVGTQDEAMRLAMNADREFARIANEDATETARWYRILGTPPLRKVFETALGLPESFGQLDLDRQLETFRARADRHLGLQSLDALEDEETRSGILERFVVRNQLDGVSGGADSGAIALTLLQAPSRAP
ncbi:DUF1217 domain-containing protein [Roseovarius salinarum]|uniref:DUF1217 domain-containing protein n=1 Tax=Roseovarius salinarum TaxID=1981892 RepID=UPI001E635EEB|nr:DUF1217 domain-containing protein [Roseovarius salinarum]